MNQKERIITYLNHFSEIDRLSALKELGIFELPARICELKRQGYFFDIEQKEGVNRYGDKYRYKVYRLKR